jgi:hypothetical protein
MAGRFIRWRLRTLGSLFSSAQERSRRTNVITRLAGAICLALLVTLVGLVSAQTLESRVADALSVQWGRIDSRPGISRPGIEGYVHNDSSYRIGLVRLRVLTRDESGHTPAEMLEWVHGNVPAHGRSYFSVRTPQAREVEKVTIESFNLIAREGPSESP